MSTNIFPINGGRLQSSDLPREFFPEIAIENVFAFGVLPAARAPTPNPLSDTTNDIGRVGVQDNGCSISWFESGQGSNRGGHLHAIFRSCRSTAGKFTDCSIWQCHYARPAAGARITCAGTVGEYQCR